MKKIVILSILLLIFAVPVLAGTCRNGRMTVYHESMNNEMTIYHNSNYGYYPNKHVWTDSEKEQPKRKPIYGHAPIGKGSNIQASSSAGITSQSL